MDEVDIFMEGLEGMSKVEQLAVLEPGIRADEVALALGMDKRTVLSRVRDSAKVKAVGGKRGRGHAWRLYPV